VDVRPAILANISLILVKEDVTHALQVCLFSVIHPSLKNSSTTVFDYVSFTYIFTGQSSPYTSTGCSNCNPGQYSFAGGVCTNCNPGTFQNNPGML